MIIKKNSELSSAAARFRQISKEISENVESVRLAIIQKKSDIRSLQRMAPSLEIVFQRIDDFVAERSAEAKRMAASVDEFFRGEEPSFPFTNHETLANAYLGDLIAERMKAEARTAYGSREGVSDAERAYQISEAERVLLDLEMTEESLIRSAEESGFKIIRRVDADPRAVLAHDKALP